MTKEGLDSFQALESLIEDISDSSSTNNHMNSRSRLGLVLFKCCLKNAARTFNIIVHRMEQMKHTPGMSIVLLACGTYILKFIPISERQKRASWAIAPLLRHAVSNDPNHITDLTRFLRSGGAEMLPCPEAFITELLLISDGIEALISKPIGLLIAQDPEHLSCMVWNFINRREFDENMLILVSSILRVCDLLPPEGELQEMIISSAVANSAPGNSFALIENSLTIIQWQTRHKKMTPEKLSVWYTSAPLNALVINCWAEYALYGDLSQLPHFEPSDDACIRKAFMVVIGNAAKNPSFDFDKLHVPHWIWDEIVAEFRDKKEYVCSDSLCSFGSDELTLCTDFFQILPERFYAHAMRYRCRTADISLRMLNIVALTPRLLLDTYFTDFVEFIEFHITRFPENASQIADCIRSLIALLLPRIDILSKRIISEIDYFNESDLTARLIVLNTIFCFRVEVQAFLDVFDSLWEVFPFLNLSLSLCTAITDFFRSVARFVKDKQQDLFMFGFSLVISIIKQADPSPFQKFTNAWLMFQACTRFYSIVSADIVNIPHYHVASTFPLARLGLLLIKELPLIDYATRSDLFRTLPLLLRIFPCETIVVAIHYMTVLLTKENKKQINLFCTELENELQYNSNTGFIMLAGTFRVLVESYRPLRKCGLLVSNIDEFSDNISETRMTLQSDSVLFPMIIMKNEHHSLLLESWAPPLDKDILDAIALSLKPRKSYLISRITRSVLFYCGHRQPELEMADSWIRRDFFEAKPTSYYALSASEPMTTSEEVLTKFANAYPVNLTSDVTTTILDLSKSYRIVPECEKAIKHLLVSHIDEILCGKGVNSFWLLRYIIASGIRCDFPEPENANSRTLLEQRDNKNKPLREELFDLKRHPSIDMIKKMMRVPLPSVAQNLLDYLRNFVDSSQPEQVQALLGACEESLLKFLGSCDMTNPLISDSVFVFINTLCMNPRIAEKCAPKYAVLFIRMLLNYKHRPSSGIYFEVLPTVGAIMARVPDSSRAKTEMVQFLNRFIAILPMSRLLIRGKKLFES